MANPPRKPGPKPSTPKGFLPSVHPNYQFTLNWHRRAAKIIEDMEYAGDKEGLKKFAAAWEKRRALLPDARIELHRKQLQAADSFVRGRISRAFEYLDINPKDLPKVTMEELYNSPANVTPEEAAEFKKVASIGPKGSKSDWNWNIIQAEAREKAALKQEAKEARIAEEIARHKRIYGDKATKATMYGPGAPKAAIDSVNPKMRELLAGMEKISKGGGSPEDIAAIEAEWGKELAKVFPGADLETRRGFERGNNLMEYLKNAAKAASSPAKNAARAAMNTVKSPGFWGGLGRMAIPDVEGQAAMSAALALGHMGAQAGLNVPQAQATSDNNLQSIMNMQRQNALLRAQIEGARMGGGGF